MCVCGSVCLLVAKCVNVLWVCVFVNFFCCFTFFYLLLFKLQDLCLYIFVNRHWIFNLTSFSRHYVDLNKTEMNLAQRRIHNIYSAADKWNNNWWLDSVYPSRLNDFLNVILLFLWLCCHWFAETQTFYIPNAILNIIFWSCYNIWLIRSPTFLQLNFTPNDHCLFEQQLHYFAGI